MEVRDFEVHAGDEWEVDARNAPGLRNRSEVAVPTRWPFSTDVWVSYGLRLYADALPPAPVDLTGGQTSNFCIVGQFHHTPDAHDHAAFSPPPLAVQLNGTGGGADLKILVRGCADDPMTSTSQIHETVAYAEPGFPLDAWVRLVLRARFERTGDGHLTVWRDGRQVADVSAPLGYNDAVGPAWKYGIYRGAAATTTRVGFADMSVGTDPPDSAPAGPGASPS